MNKRIFIIDDLIDNIKLLATIIQEKTDYSISFVQSAKDALEFLDNPSFELPHLILLDVMMPEMDGFELASILKKRADTKEIPIIFVTGLNNKDNIVNAFKNGGVDYITKPFHVDELLARINTHIQLNSIIHHLESIVQEKTEEVKNINMTLVNALENANLMNDNDTGFHIQRVNKISTLLATEHGCDKNFIEQINLYSSLHDLGKVGIHDSILKKTGKYTPEEYEEMKKHVEIGAKMLDAPHLSKIAKNIALYHHEKWDGTGYISGLKAEEIPLEARIVSLADVYDALTSQRPYKKAFSEEKADQIIREDSGKAFDPHLVNTFFRIKDRIIRLKEELESI